MGITSVAQATGPGAVAGSIKLLADPLLNTGSKYLFDYTELSVCNKNAAGVLAAGSIFTDLISNVSTPGAPLTAVVSGTITNNAGSTGLSLPGGASTGALAIGAASQFDFSSSNHDILIIEYVKFPTTPFVASNSPWLLHSTAIGGNMQYGFSVTTSGTIIKGVYYNTSNQAQSIPASGTLNAAGVTQIAMHISPTMGVVHTYVNGVLNNTFNSAAWTYPANASVLTIAGYSVSNNGGFQGNLYRDYLEDITVSAAAAGLSTTAQAAAQVALAYATTSSYS